MRWHVFISYARSSGGEWAKALHDALEDAGVNTFLDARDESVGASISQQVFESLLGSRVVVVFADTTYFTRRYCVEELSAALRAYRALRGHSDRDELEAAVRPVVVALPPMGEPLGDLELLPPEVRSKNWPAANETQWLADLVRERLERVPETIGARLGRLGELDELRARLHEMIDVPAPKQLSGVPVYHETGMPPSIGDGFVGRARELWELHEALAVRQGHAAALTTALEGGGGFGKTRLALEYVHRYGPLEYRGGIFWVNADVPEDRLEAQQHGILKLLRNDVPELAAFRESGREVARELGAALQDVARDRPILFVVDNVPEPQGDRLPEPLSRWCPAAGQVSLLLTSRSRLTLVGGITRVPVRELPEAAAMRLLLRDFEDRGALPEASWRQVVGWVGEWPLALELVNASLQAGAVSPGELLSAAMGGGPTTELERQMAALRGAVADGTLRGVAEALRMSYRRLPERTRQAARRLALLAPNPIPVRLVSGLEPNVRVLLRVRSFVSEVRSGDVEMYGRMHRVVADFLRGEIEERELEMIEACDALLEVLKWEAAADPASWPLLNACRPHAEAVLDHVSDGPVAAELAERLVKLCRVICRLLRKQGQPGTAAELGERCTELARRTLGPQHLTTIAATANQAWCLRGEGRMTRSRELHEWVLDARLRLLGEDDPETLYAMRNLALTLMDQGDRDHARTLQEQVLETWRRRGEEDHPNALWDMSSLGLTLRDQGDLARARELEERVLRARQAMGGEKYPDTLWAMSSLAQTLRAQGELEPARTLQEEVVETSRRLLTDEHPDSLRAMSELAVTLRAIGERDEAIVLQRQVFDTRLRLLGEEHPDTQRAAHELNGTLGEGG